MTAVLGASAVATAVTALLIAAPHVVQHPALRASLVQQLEAWTGGKVEITGDIRLSSLIALTVEAHGMKISGATRIEPVASVDAQSIKAIVSLPQLLAGRVVVSKVVFSSVNIVLDRILPDSLASTGPDPDFLGTPVAFMRGNPFKELVLKHATVRYPAGDREPLAAISVAQARLSRNPSGAADLDCQITSGAERIQFSVQAGAPSEASVPLSLKIARDGITASFKGTLDITANQLAGQIAITSSAVQPLTQSLTSAFLPWQMETITALSGDMSWSRGRFSLDEADFRSETLHAKGSLALSYKTQRTALEGTLAYDFIDLSPFLNADAGPGLERLSAQAGPAFDFPQPAFDIRLSSDKVRLGQSIGGPLAIALTRQQARLGLDVAELGLLGGTIHGRLDYDPGAALSLSLKMAGSRLDGASLAASLPLPAVTLTGQADVTLDMRAGFDAAANAIHLAEGNFMFALPKGGTVSAEASRKLSERPEAANLGWASIADGTLTWSKLSVSGSLSDGALAADIKGESGAGFLTSSVTIGLGDSGLKGMVSLGDKSIDTSAGDPGIAPPFESAARPAYTFLISGTTSNLSLSVAANPLGLSDMLAGQNHAFPSQMH